MSERDNERERRRTKREEKERDWRAAGVASGRRVRERHGRVKTNRRTDKLVTGENRASLDFDKIN